MTYNPFSVVVVPFPFSDRAQKKRRPAIVLSSPKHQKETDHITLLMITSAKKSSWPTDYLLNDLPETGLSSDSIVRQKIFTLDNRLIIKRIGDLSKTDKKNVLGELKTHLTHL